MLNLPPGGLLKTIAILFFILILLFPLSGLATQKKLRTDLIFIQLADTDGVHQMPDAVFLHDKHTRAQTEQDCSKCHMKEKNTFIFKFNRVKDGGYDADQKLYHEKCIGCHQEKRNQGIKSGPITSECRLCHSQASVYSSSATSFGLNKSLHYRHEISEAIPPTGEDKDRNCDACHHEYDKDLNKTTYVKGKEGTCRYCHKTENTYDARAFQTVAHEDCLNCHYQLKANNKKAGPTDCSGCHDAARQSKIETIENIPRIRRNQPDSELLSFWLKEAIKNGKPSRQFIKPVAFNHKSHETSIETCYACHHASMDSCSKCHTRTGTENSQDIRLETAMHATKSPTSCIGCHSEKLADKNCAGCHSLMRSKNFSNSNCNKCHTISKKLLEPIPGDDRNFAEIAESEINLRDTPQSLVPDKEIPENETPETVTIDIMKDQYEGATFPHRKIVQALLARTQQSKLAKHFHNGEQTLCTGCHHFTPASVTPPKCASCHGKAPMPEPDGRPGLKGAYHGQCIGCHQEMGIEKPVSTDCTSCHQLRTKSAQPSK
ncbi:MAG: cytochrome C [Desulfobacteraceae bacterium]|nr:cytochrome C [Desulfobacteraceae bacterium]MBC2755284.1 cytochrome C [Desulfobacteraceae bacterium]